MHIACNISCSPSIYMWISFTKAVETDSQSVVMFKCSLNYFEQCIYHFSWILLHRENNRNVESWNAASLLLGAKLQKISTENWHSAQTKLALSAACASVWIQCVWVWEGCLPTWYHAVCSQCDILSWARKYHSCSCLTLSSPTSSIHLQSLPLHHINNTHILCTDFCAVIYFLYFFAMFEVLIDLLFLSIWMRLNVQLEWV